MSLVKVPLHTCSLWAVAELSDVLSRTVARLPAGMVTALAPATALATRMASMVNLRNFIRSPSKNDSQNFGPPWSKKNAEKLFGDDFNLHAFCYTLAAGIGGTNALLAFRAITSCSWRRCPGCSACGQCQSPARAVRRGVGL